MGGADTSDGTPYHDIDVVGARNSEDGPGSVFGMERETVKHTEMEPVGFNRTPSWAARQHSPESETKQATGFFSALGVLNVLDVVYGMGTLEAPSVFFR